jgi:hypothetical protein
MEWFKNDTFNEATRLAKVTGRTFFLAQPKACLGAVPTALPRPTGNLGAGGLPGASGSRGED